MSYPLENISLTIKNLVSIYSKIYDTRGDFDFDIVNLPFLDGDIPRATSNGVYISQLIQVREMRQKLNNAAIALC